MPHLATASALGELLHARLIDHGEATYLVRDEPVAGFVLGEVAANYYTAPPDPEPDESTAMAEFDIMFEVRSASRDEDVRLAEARLIFDDVAGTVPCAALFVHNLGLLIAAWSPSLGLTVFPAGTTPYFQHYNRWAPYVLPTEHD